MTQELILVYNADSGLVNLIKDALHKTISPSTYQCNLCALTYGTIGVKAEWKRFVASLEVPATFLHRDEFYARLESHPHDLRGTRFPAVFLDDDGAVSLLIDAAAINRCEALEDLMALITSTLERRAR
jgi:hypothetical protein